MVTDALTMTYVNEEVIGLEAAIVIEIFLGIVTFGIAIFQGIDRGRIGVVTAIEVANPISNDLDIQIEVIGIETGIEIETEVGDNYQFIVLVEYRKTQ